MLPWDILLVLDEHWIAADCKGMLKPRKLLFVCSLHSWFCSSAYMKICFSELPRKWKSQEIHTADVALF